MLGLDAADVTARGTIALVVVTAIYVVLTGLVVRSAAKTAKSAQAQVAALNLPQVYCRIFGDRRALRIITSNVGGVPAFDVDLLIFCTYQQHTKTPEAFLEEHGDEQRVGDNPPSLVPDEDGAYCFIDRIIYSIFPTQRSVEAVVAIPPGDQPLSLYVLMQYGAPSGECYLHGHFFWEDSGGSSRYRLGAMDPTSASPFPRLQIDITRGRFFREDDRRLRRRRLPRLVREMQDLIPHSVSASYLKEVVYEIEDRGEWSSRGSL